MVKVLHVLGALNPGGVEVWLMNVLRHIDRCRFRLDFCTFGSELGVFAPEVERLGSRVTPCPLQPLWTLGWRFRRILREGKYDAVHSHVHHFSGAVLRWATAERVPMRIAHSHSSRDGKRSTLPRRLYRLLMQRWIRCYATHGLAASKLAGDSLFHSGWQGNGHYRVLYYGIDLKPFEQPVDRAEVRREFGIPADASVVGHVGRFVEPKNHKFLIEIAREVIAQRPDVHFLLVGDGPLRPAIEARVRELGLNANVHFAGVRHDVPRLMLGAMDALVFPSLWEGLPVTLLEAQAAGLPCVVSSTISSEAIAERYRMEWLSLEGNCQMWARSVIRSLGDPKLSIETPITHSVFSIENSAAKMSQFYAG